MQIPPPPGSGVDPGKGFCALFCKLFFEIFNYIKLTHYYLSFFHFLYCHSLPTLLSKSYIIMDHFGQKEAIFVLFDMCLCSVCFGACLCLCVCFSACECVYAYVCVYVYTCMCVWVCVCMCVYVCVCVFVGVCVCV